MGEYIPSSDSVNQRRKDDGYAGASNLAAVDGVFDEQVDIAVRRRVRQGIDLLRVGMKKKNQLG